MGGGGLGGSGLARAPNTPPPFPGSQSNGLHGRVQAANVPTHRPRPADEVRMQCKSRPHRCSPAATHWPRTVRRGLCTGLGPAADACSGPPPTLLAHPRPPMAHRARFTPRPDGPMPPPRPHGPFRCRQSYVQHLGVRRRHNRRRWWAGDSVRLSVGCGGDVQLRPRVWPRRWRWHWGLAEHLRELRGRRG